MLGEPLPVSGLAAVAGGEMRLWDKPLQCLPLLHLCFVTLLLLDGQDALTLFDQLHSAVRDEPDGQGADRET